MRFTTEHAQHGDNRPRLNSPDFAQYWTMAVMGLLVLCPITVVPMPAHAMGERLVLTDMPITRCVVTGVQGLFGFTESTYTITGVCSEFKANNPAGTSTFENEREVRRIPWTAEGRYEAGTRATRERIVFTNEGHFIESTMQCVQDPWLTVLSQPCANILDTIGLARPSNSTSIVNLKSTDLRVLRQANPGTPFSSLLRSDHRMVLNQHYQASRASLPKSKPPTAQYRLDSPVIGALRPGVAETMVAPPELISPMPGNVVPQGAILVKILRSLGGRAEVEFTWLDQPPLPPGVVPENKTWLVTMDQLAAGAIAPAQMTDKPGRWQVRGRKILDYSARWSQMVPFQVVMAKGQQLVEPPRTQKDLMTAPTVPGMVRKPQLGEASELNPHPLPPQAIPGVIMKPPDQDAALNPQPLPPKMVVPGVIMRRGVDEKARSSEEQKAGSKEKSPAADTK